MCRRLLFLISFAAVLIVADSASAELVGHWRFDGNLDDSAGEAHGTFNGGSPVYVAGRIGQGIDFDGVSHFAHLPSANPSAYTITSWVRPARTSAASVIARTSSSGPTTHWSHQLRINPQGAFHHYLWVGSERNIPGTTLVQADEWYHVAIAAATNGPMHLYVNGEEDAPSINVAGTLWGDGDRYYVGSNSGHAMGWFQGVVDDVQIYDSILTAEEVGRIAASSGGFPLAFGPTPKDGALHADTWVSLSWKPGDFAVSHDVYLGDDFDDVNNATHESETFRGNQTSTYFVAGFPGFPYPDGLVPGTTYYWRIDEVNDAEPNSPWKGPIWRFSIPPKTAYNPSPADGAEFVATDVKLSWTAGFGAKLHAVYFGDNFDAVSNAAGGPPQGLTTYNPGPLQPEKVYYWRVDEFDAVAWHKGNIWAFTTPGAAGAPQPANGATGVQMVAKLSWTPATNAVSHDVYFGTDKAAVRNATKASPEFKGNKTKGSESHDPGKLAWHSDYYWRVDAVYNTGTVKGLVWSFTTADFITVDDFESYNDIDPPDPASNRIFDAWIDGFGTTNNGALVGNDMPPYAEQTTVHSGAQSMPYSYDNNLKTSEATLTLVYPRDWTEEGVTKLSLWFRGASANVADRMYVALNGNAVVYHDDPAVTQKTGWNRWVIDLQAFQGVTLTNVNTITIGFGTKNGPAAGGAGRMYFDDIRLYR